MYADVHISALILHSAENMKLVAPLTVFWPGPTPSIYITVSLHSLAFAQIVAVQEIIVFSKLC